MTTPDTVILTMVLLGAGILFIIAYIGNLLTFSNRVINAFVTAIIFALIYVALYFAIGRTILTAGLEEISPETWFQMIGMSAVLVFIIDLVANMFSFSNRFMSALTTAIVFAVLLGVLMYTAGKIPGTPT